MKSPQRLLPGSRIALVATARKINPEEIQPAIELLQSWQLEVIVEDGLFYVDNQMAGNDTHRAAMLQRYINDDSIDAILCVRGGYGTVRIIDKIDFSPLLLHPKWIIGYSDVTALHCHVSRHCQLTTLHATMPINIPADTTQWNTPALTSLHHTLFNGATNISANSCPLNRIGHCHAPIIGGNLSVLYSISGSDSDIDTDGKILFIEDLDEYLYHIDRMMQNLKRSGKLEQLKGLIVGAMSDMHDNIIPFGHTAEEIIRNTVQEYSYPVAFHLPIGHIGLTNQALLLGVPSTLDVTETGTQLTQIC